jgi:hypothetical protein
MRMNHDDYDYAFNRADRMPTLFARTHPFDECDAMRVVEHESRGFEINAMLCLVALILRLMPLKSDHVIT